jgi:hypothetical protein
MSILDHLILLPGSIHEGHAALEDSINLTHLLISVRIFPMLINSPGFLQHWHCRAWYLLPISENFALFQIMPMVW